MTAIAGALKNVYDKEYQVQQNLKHRAIDEIAKSLTKYNAGGNGFYGAIKDYGNETVGAINEEEQFRTIDAEHYLQYKVSTKVLVAPIQFSGLASAAADSDDEAFCNAVIDALDSAKERLLADENRQFFGYGQGTLGQPGAALASNLTSFTVQSAQYFRANQVVDFYTSFGGAAIVTGLRVSDVDRVNSVVYLSTSLTISIQSSNNVIVKQNILASSPPADGKEMMGLRGIVDDGTDLTTFQNITCNTSNFIWRGRRISVSVNLTSDLLQRLIDDVRIYSGEEPDTLIMHPLQRRKYLDLVVPQKRYQDGKMDTGFTKLEFNGTELWLDKDCQTDTVYAVNKKYLRKFEVKPLSMGQQDGSDQFLRLSNFDQFQAYWKHYANFGTSRRNAHGKIVGLTTPSGIA